MTICWLLWATASRRALIDDTVTVVCAKELWLKRMIANRMLKVVFVLIEVVEVYPLVR